MNARLTIDRNMIASQRVVMKGDDIKQPKFIIFLFQISLCLNYLLSPHYYSKETYMNCVSPVVKVLQITEAVACVAHLSCADDIFLRRAGRKGNVADISCCFCSLTEKKTFDR